MLDYDSGGVYMSSNKYDDEDYNERNGEMLKRLGIVVLVIVTIILLFFLLKGCVNKNRNNNNNNNNPTPVVNKDLSSVLLEAGKDYYKANSHYLPSYGGECDSVSLLALSQQGFIDRLMFTSCNNETTYVKVCKLSNGRYQYVPFLACTNEVTESKYSSWKEGDESKVVADSTDVNFLFQAQYLNTSSNNLGPVETMWQDEIKYQNYKTVSSTKYYRYRDLQYVWSVKTSTYYPGNVTEASKVKEYYTSSPASGYTNKSNQNNSVAKYFSTTQEKVYWVDANGVKKIATTAPDSVYIYRDNPIHETRWSSRTWTETSKPVTTASQEIWYCASANDVTQYVSDLPCNVQTTNPNYTITVKHIYSCDGGITDVGQNGVCPVCTDGQGLKVTKDSCGYYGEWSSWSKTPCDTTKTDVCETRTITAYNWYKLERGERTYYPSGSKLASGEKTYYAQSPKSGLIRDEETVTTGWKWYKSSESTTGYSTTSPQPGAVKTNTSKWTEFTNWSTVRPESLGSSGTREIQTKTKVELRQIVSNGSTEWKVFNEEYLTLEELIKQLKAKGYKVESLEDIVLNGELQYKTKILTRDKEVK